MMDYSRNLGSRKLISEFFFPELEFDFFERKFAANH
jgi:hypothetical protein